MSDEPERNKEPPDEDERGDRDRKKEEDCKMSSTVKSIVERAKAAAKGSTETSEDSVGLLSSEADPEAAGGGGGGDGSGRRRSSSRGGGGDKVSSKAMSDFVFIKIVARLALGVLRRFWHVSSVAILAIILLYWLCGGLMAFLLVVFAVTGIFYHAGDR